MTVTVSSGGLPGGIVEPAVQPGTADTPVVPAIGAVVSRAALFGRLCAAGRVTEVSAPAGSGKTYLLRSWIGQAGACGRAAWVAVPEEERDPQRFWIAIARALRGTDAASGLVRPLTAAPDLDGWAIVEQLLADLAGLEGEVWLVIDDVHQLASAEALAQLKLLVMRAPPQLRFVLATRHDLQLGLHRLRLEGQLTEIRAADLRFTLEEARALFESAGVELTEPALRLMHERTEGWAAGLRLAALSLDGQPDPERFATEFSGSERTVADYLLAEVLERQSEDVRRLLLRTSVAEQVSGELADLLTGGSGGERVLQELERAGAFVVSLDMRRSWFRYHRMFADLLRLQLKATAPGEVPALHRAAAGWFAENGFPVEAVRHAQAAEDWELAVGLLSDHWIDFDLNGQGATAHELLIGFPVGVVAANAELTVLVAFDELARGSLERAERYLTRVEREFEGGEGHDEGPVSVPAERRGHLQVLLASARLALARQRGDLPGVAEAADRLLVLTEDAELRLGEDLRARAVISLGIAEVWSARLEDAGRHLEQGVALARRIGRPYLELTGLAHGAVVAGRRSYAAGAQRSKQAIELAERHGWGEDQAVGVAYAILGGALVGQGRLEEAEPWLDRAGRILRAKAEPATGMNLHFARWALDMARGRYADALAAIKAAERLAATLVTPSTSAELMRARMWQTLVQLGDTGHVEAALARLDFRERQSAEVRIALAGLRLAQHEPRAATTALAPILDGSVPEVPPVVMVTAVLLEAIARDALGDLDAAGGALRRALDLAQPDGMLIPFLIHPAPGLLERYARQRTAHAALIAEILGLLGGRIGGTSSPPKTRGGPGGIVPLEASAGSPAGIVPPRATLREPLSQAETRVLRYLPTNFTVPEIATQLCLSVNTIRTHMRHIYDKLGAHRRHEVIERARALGLLAPATRTLSASPGARTAVPFLGRHGRHKSNIFTERLVAFAPRRPGRKPLLEAGQQRLDFSSLHRDGSELRVLERFTGGVLHESTDGVVTGRRGRLPGVGLVRCLLWREILAGP